MSKGGLSRKHHSFLNKVLGVKKEDYDSLREEYKDDNVALQQIDVYDHNTEYHSRLRRLINKLKRGEEGTDDELQWFDEHYPDI